MGEALERTAASEAELAHHFIEAAPVGDPAKALEHAHRAGHEALAALAYERAADLFDAALSALDLLPEPDEPRRGELLLLRGQAQMQSGGDAARSTLLAAIELARRVGDADLLARAALSLGGFGLSPGMVDDDLVAVLEEALQRPAARRQRAARAPARAPGRRAVLLRMRRSAARTSSRRRSASRAGSTTRRRWPTSSTRARSPPTGPTPPSAAWPGPTSSSPWPTPPATRSSRSARARGRSTCCSSSTTSPAPTWRSRRSTASPPTRATRAPAPTSRCTARGGR